MGATEDEELGPKHEPGGVGGAGDGLLSDSRRRWWAPDLRADGVLTSILVFPVFLLCSQVIPQSKDVVACASIQ